MENNLFRTNVQTYFRQFVFLTNDGNSKTLDAVAVFERIHGIEKLADIQGNIAVDATTMFQIYLSTMQQRSEAESACTAR